jgi:hypothetical protein
LPARCAGFSGGRLDLRDLAFNVIDAGTFAYPGVPLAILVVAAVCGLLARWLTGCVYPGVLIAGIAMLVLSLVAIGWALLAVAASSVI